MLGSSRFVNMVVCRGRDGSVGLDCRDMVHVISERNVNQLALGYHFVVELPACTTGELGHYNIAVAKKIDIEVNMVDGIS